MGTQLQKKRNTRRLEKSSPPAPPPSIPDTRRWLRVSEVAIYLGLSLQHIYRMHRRGQLPSFKLSGVGVRIDRSALDRKIEVLKNDRAARANTNWPI